MLSSVNRPAGGAERLSGGGPAGCLGPFPLSSACSGFGIWPKILGLTRIVTHDYHNNNNERNPTMRAVRSRMAIEN